MKSIIQNINFLEKTQDYTEYEYYFNRLENYPLFPLYCGYEKCRTGKSYGPGMRDHYYYHYVYSGSGKIQTRNMSIAVKAGEGFLGFPNEIITYSASEDHPWQYIWIAFSGPSADEIISACNIKKEYPIVNHTNPHLSSELLFSIIQCAKEHSLESYLQANGFLYFLLSHLYSDNHLETNKIYNFSVNHYLNNALLFIKENYHTNISVKNIAQHIGISEVHLNRLFKAQYNLSTSEYLSHYRLNHAIHLLTHTNLPINEIANEVGFNDHLYFSKWFKKHLGSPPSTIRKQRQKNIAHHIP